MPPAINQKSLLCQKGIGEPIASSSMRSGTLICGSVRSLMAYLLSTTTNRPTITPIINGVDFWSLHTVAWGHSEQLATGGQTMTTLFVVGGKALIGSVATSRGTIGLRSIVL